MNFTLNNIDKVNAELTAVVEPADYTEKYNKALKDAKKKINMPGFRPGMVPVGLIKKQFGASILAEEINKILQEGLFNYIRENKVNMLGEPLPTEQNNIELKEGNTFEFKFELAIAPEFNAEVSKDDKVPYYNVEISEEMVNRQIDAYRQQGGSYNAIGADEEYQDNDMVKGILSEKDGSIQVEGAVVLPKYFKNEDQKALFNGVKPNTVIEFNPSVAYDNNEAELTSLLKVEKEDCLNHKGEFTYQITEITRFQLGPVDEALFENIFPGAEIKTEEAFRAKVKESIAEQFAKDSDYRFIIDARKYITEKVGKLEFPDEKLKRIMLANVKGDQQKVDEGYDKSIEELTWHLIKEQLVAANEVKVDDNDVKEMAKEVTKMQFAQYGMLNIPEEYLEGSVKQMLSKRETVDNLIDRCIEVKLGAALKQKMTLEEKTVTAEEFNKLFEAEA